ncbi:hypothetical protein SADUNF_Sadunf01G0029100 [Salix dunnii]|uniref:Uncharacterized protein n=2 Tax=Salix TaxID=40685 RepID=A0A835TLT7_9ROSI|nr:hypothetical protein SADUNF_Sadunf01G0029100 [Salix dunnii]
MDVCVLSEYSAFGVFVAIVIKVFSFRGAQNSHIRNAFMPSISLNIILPTNTPNIQKVRGDGTYGTRRINNKLGAGLAGLKSIAVRVVGGFGRRRKAKTKKIKVEDELMDLWHKMIFPVRRVWLAVSARLKARKNGANLLKLHNDVQTCGYEDVQVMWEMLRRSESELIASHPKRKQRPFWRVFVWSNHSAASSFSANHS